MSQEKDPLFINITSGIGSAFEPYLNSLYFASQAIASVYTLLLVVIFIVVVYVIFSSVKQLRKFENSLQHVCYDKVMKIAKQRERILCFTVALLLLIFEIAYPFLVNITGFVYILFSSEYQAHDVNISDNCVLKATTYLATIYDPRLLSIVIIVISLGGCRCCFFLTIWLFSVSLLNLNFAAREQYKPKVIIYWIVAGVAIGVIMFALLVIPWSNFVAVILVPISTQIALLWVILNYRRFSVSMKMRINEAYHSWNEQSLNEQEKLFVKYKSTVSQLVFIYEIAILRELVLFNVYILLETIALNSCWFGAIFGFSSTITLSVSTVRIMAEIAFYSFISGRILEITFFSLNVIVLCWFMLKAFIDIRKTNKPHRYRYNTGDLKESLIQNTFNDHTQ